MKIIIVLCMLLTGEITQAQCVVVPRNIIVDTDWATDVDDVVAMRVLTYAHIHHKINLLAAMQSTTVGSGPGSLLGFLRADGVYIPVGTSTSVNYATGRYQSNVNYLAISRSLITGSETYTDAVTLYRQILATASAPIDIVSIGFLNNLTGLLQSPADDISQLTGLQLVTAKVGRLYVMGGMYPGGMEYNFSHNAIAIAAASYVTSNWPTAVIYSGYWVGQSVVTGITVKYLQPVDMLAEAMMESGTFTRSSWDPMNALLAVIGEPMNAGYTEVYGSNSVNASTGANTFTKNSTGKDRYVVKVKDDGFYQSAINFFILKTNW